MATIRPAVPSDLAAIADLLGELGYTPKRDDLAAASSSPGQLVLVADVEGRTVGLLVVVVRRVLHLAGLIGELDTLVVSSAFRSRGIGRALLEAGVAEAQRVGAAHLEVHSKHSRRDAHRFYEQNGFASLSRHFVREIGPENG